MNKIAPAAVLIVLLASPVVGAVRVSNSETDSINWAIAVRNDNSVNVTDVAVKILMFDNFSGVVNQHVVSKEIVLSSGSSQIVYETANVICMFTWEIYRRGSTKQLKLPK